MWAEIESRLDRLRSWYAGGGPVNVSGLCNEVTAYFVACYQLKDQIKRDPGVPRRAAASSVICMGGVLFGSVANRV
jgi:hypothetical protein